MVKIYYLIIFIKKGTLRKRLSVQEFILQLESGFLKQGSLDRNPIVQVRNEQDEIVEEANKNLKNFHLGPSIDLDDYTTSYQSEKLNKHFQRVNYNNNKYFCTPSSDKITKLAESECIKLFNNDNWS